MSEQVLCHECNGSGQIDVIVNINGVPMVVPMVCQSCGGTGRL